jgi:choline dehydrogenase-like flavoprotein
MANMLDSRKKRTYDAIVIGSGASGGWAAKELCDKGLKTLILERGRDVKHVRDYPTAGKSPWQFEHRGTVPLERRKDFQFASFVREETMHWAVRDDEQPFIQEKPFRWVRGYHMGGKSLLWARQTQRWSDFDFEGPTRDGFATDWPIRYRDLEPWYRHASTLNSNAILLNSTSSRFPNGLGNDNGLLGKYVAWHNYRGRANAQYEGFQDKKTDGRRPTHAYMPRFRNVFRQETDFLRGYAIGVASGRGAWSDTSMIGNELRENLLHPILGKWNFSMWMMGETVPLEKNHVRLHPDLKDKYGIPQLIVSCDWSENDDKMVADYIEQCRDMLEKAGFVNISTRDTHSPPGADIHEMGGVRMGRDPKTSLLNEWNQLHHCKNVFVTDGSCMTSTATQNPTLTFMAITARAANYAVEELGKKG